MLLGAENMMLAFAGMLLCAHESSAPSVCPSTISHDSIAQKYDSLAPTVLLCRHGCGG